MREHVCMLFLRLVTCSGQEIVVSNGLEERRRAGGQGERGGLLDKLLRPVRSVPALQYTKMSTLGDSKAEG